MVPGRLLVAAGILLGPGTAVARSAGEGPDQHDEARAPDAGIQPPEGTPQRPPAYGARTDWSITAYGYARFDAIEDSTQSFEDGLQPNLIARVGTYRGDHRRTILTARDSRLGVFAGAPPFGGIRSFAQIELDFYGLVPSDARRHDSVVFGPLRIRHAFFRLESRFVDLLVGQYHDLFGWGGHFYPATFAYLGVPAQVYHRNPQLRLEKRVQFGQVELMAAVALVRPGQRDSGIPDGQAGIKLAYGGWSGAAIPGFGRPLLSPLSIGISAIYRRFELPAFRAEPGSEAVRTHGYGVAASMLLPLVRAKNLADRGNALTLTGEFSSGAGIADMYTGMDGGHRFPLLPNPGLSAPAVQYQANIDPGLVAVDRTLTDFKALRWQAFVVGLQYFLPIARGRVWVSGTYSSISSSNILELTPGPSLGGIFTRMDYFDGNLGFNITPSIVLGLSFQSVAQWFGDVAAPTPVYGTIAGAMPPIPTVPGTGGEIAHARNNRAQLTMAMSF